ncbi:MAG: hypothetical protein ABRQ39_17925 [Candidatus Eremiobacterota bacterium]
MKCHAVLIDTVSIQKYVFGSNKLKENLGASYLVEEIYNSLLHKALKKIFPGLKIDLNGWKNNPEQLLIQTHPFEAAYIGGGNALLFFKEENKAKSFINEWTKILLIDTPGITTAVAYKEFDLENFKDSLKEVFKLLRENKATYIPQTVLPRHGITAECSRSGYSMEIWNSSEEKYISSVTNAKIEASVEAKKELLNEFKDLLGEDFTFTDNLEELGQIKEKDSHIAIVHIDGNGMGKRFQACKSLEEIRHLSSSVENATKQAFRELVGEIISNFHNIDREVSISKTDNKIILPLRPIILGGDDITFVSDGKFGIYFAKLFMEAFGKESVSDGKPLSSCAGIAITKTKFPFYRGYELAEQLCSGAKIKRNKEKDDGSWIDFHIAYGGFSGTLKEIRDSNYKSHRGDLLFRPYRLHTKEEYDFDSLITNTATLKEFPRLKIKELRDVLTEGEESGRTFIIEQKYRERSLPKIEGKNYEISLFENNKTPYFDMIEIMEFYPSFLLKERKV